MLLEAQVCEDFCVVVEHLCCVERRLASRAVDVLNGVSSEQNSLAEEVGKHVVDAHELE